MKPQLKTISLAPVPDGDAIIDRPILPHQCFECNLNRAERRYLVRLSYPAEMYV
jgi:hypothetical protein